MKAIDIVKPRPTTQLDFYMATMNNIQSNTIAGSIFSKKIIVEECTGGRLTGCICSKHEQETHDFNMEMADEGRDE